MRSRGWLLLGLVALLPLGACDDDDDGDPVTGPEAPSEMEQLVDDVREWLPTSLHATAQGMRDWYEQPDGFGAMIGVDYGELGCGGCHVPSGDEGCEACHVSVAAILDGTDVVDSEVSCVKACHGRQRAEIAMGLPDVHREADMDCADCHTLQEIHGDGTFDNHMFEDDVFDVRCADCHVEGGDAPVPPRTRSHTVHADDLSCEACHQSASVNCYNCHFAEEVENHRKVAYSKFSDWVFLGNYRGMVYPMNFQSVEFEGQTFNAWGPFHGHTITSQGRECAACHGNATLVELDRNPALKMVTWDETLNKLVHRRGIIPLVPGFETRFLFDYVTKQADGSGWMFLETGPDQTQFRFGSPLTEDQLDLLRVGM